MLTVRDPKYGCSIHNSKGRGTPIMKTMKGIASLQLGNMAACSQWTSFQ